MNIRLRKLEKKDAVLMLEWMHDENCQKGFKKNMASYTLERVEEFCCSAASEVKDRNVISNIHIAIVDEKDEYLGTVSLKNINFNDNNAEYAIVIRPSFQRKGIAYEASKKILKIGFEKYGLNKIYLTVFEDNIGAIFLYEKLGFVYEGTLRNHIFVNNVYKNWKLYGILESEYYEQYKKS